MRPPLERQETTGEVPESLVRTQLEQILASETFFRSERLSGFLRFVVERTLGGEAATLKEQVLASELYGRGSNFDTRADPVVRVDARRLRDKLREYYAEHPSDPLLITLPKGAYVPVFEARPAAPAQSLRQPGPSSGARAPRAQRLLWIVGVGGLLAAILAAAWLLNPRDRQLPSKLIPLTAYPGNEGQASLSPDGNFVAFACTPPDPSAQADICVKGVGTEVKQRVTETPTAEYWPRWSPDGREILFGRGPRGEAPGYQEFGQELGIFVVSRMGGPERKISETGAIAGWAPDGKSVLIRDRLTKEEPYAIFQVDLSSSERRRLTKPPLGAGDWLFDVSPDGRTLAVIRFSRAGIGDLYLAPMKGGEPRRLTDWNRYLTGVAWTPDGKELVYSLDGRLWRISAGLAGPAHGSPIPDIPMQPNGVTISRPGAGRPARLVFQTFRRQISLRRMDLQSAGAGNDIPGILPFAPATRDDVSPGRFSPDGSRVAFVSNRGSEHLELWIANSDGTNPRQLTFFGSAAGMLAGSWSPDGKRILFDAAIEGNNDVYVIPAEGGKPARLTTGPAMDTLADWSRDGRWIYFTSEAERSVSNIWRVPADGGAPEQITTQGGFDPQESPDGQYLYYLDRSSLAGKGRLMRMPTRGGEAEALLEGVTPFLWSVTAKGIYFLQQEEKDYSVHLHRFSDGGTTRVGTLSLRLAPVQIPGRLTVSPDGRWALVNVAAPREGDLVLLDNFR